MTQTTRAEDVLVMAAHARGTVRKIAESRQKTFGPRERGSSCVGMDVKKQNEKLREEIAELRQKLSLLEAKAQHAPSAAEDQGPCAALPLRCC